MAEFKVIQILLSEPSDKISKMMKHNESLFDSYEVVYKWDVKNKYFYNNIPKGVDWHWARSDVIRFEYLSTYNNILYLDWDVKANYVPELNDITWAPGYDNWAMFNSNRKEVFKDILEKGINELLYTPAWRKLSKVWLVQFIKAFGGNTFEKGCFTHGK